MGLEHEQGAWLQVLGAPSQNHAQSTWCKTAAPGSHGNLKHSACLGSERSLRINKKVVECLTRVRSQHSSQCTCQHWMEVKGIVYESCGEKQRRYRRWEGRAVPPLRSCPLGLISGALACLEPGKRVQARDPPRPSTSGTRKHQDQGGQKS